MLIEVRFVHCPGDTLVYSAGLASLKLKSPKTRIRVSGVGAEFFHHCPYITKGGVPDQVVFPKHPLISYSGLPYHAMISGCQWLSDVVGFPVPLSYNSPQVYLSAEEVRTPFLEHDYWVVCQPGAKKDYTVKRWPTSWLQGVVNNLPEVSWVQVGETGHDHTPLEGVKNLIGRTTLRQLLHLVGHRHCRGVVTGESLLWHVAAAFKKPAVCIASGMFPRSWCDYPTGTFISRQGCLPCCRYGACNFSRVVRLGDGSERDESLCQLPVLAGGEMVGRCMEMISVQDVVSAVRNYIDGGVAKPMKRKHGMQLWA